MISSEAIELLRAILGKTFIPPDARTNKDHARVKEDPGLRSWVSWINDGQKSKNSDKTGAANMGTESIVC